MSSMEEQIKQVLKLVSQGSLSTKQMRHAQQIITDYRASQAAKGSGKEKNPTVSPPQVHQPLTQRQKLEFLVEMVHQGPIPSAHLQDVPLLLKELKSMTDGSASHLLQLTVHQQRELMMALLRQKHLQPLDIKQVEQILDKLNKTHRPKEKLPPKKEIRLADLNALRAKLTKPPLTPVLEPVTPVHVSDPEMLERLIQQVREGKVPPDQMDAVSAIVDILKKSKKSEQNPPSLGFHSANIAAADTGGLSLLQDKKVVDQLVDRLQKGSIPVENVQALIASLKAQSAGVESSRGFMKNTFQPITESEERSNLVKDIGNRNLNEEERKQKLSVILKLVESNQLAPHEIALIQREVAALKNAPPMPNALNPEAPKRARKSRFDVDVHDISATQPVQRVRELIERSTLRDKLFPAVREEVLLHHQSEVALPHRQPEEELRQVSLKRSGEQDWQQHSRDTFEERNAKRRETSTDRDREWHQMKMLEENSGQSSSRQSGGRDWQRRTDTSEMSIPSASKQKTSSDRDRDWQCRMEVTDDFSHQYKSNRSSTGSDRDVQRRRETFEDESRQSTANQNRISAGTERDLQHGRERFEEESRQTTRNRSEMNMSSDRDMQGRKEMFEEDSRQGTAGRGRINAFTSRDMPRRGETFEEDPCQSGLNRSGMSTSSDRDVQRKRETFEEDIRQSTKQSSVSASTEWQRKTETSGMSTDLNRDWRHKMDTSHANTQQNNSKQTGVNAAETPSKVEISRKRPHSPEPKEPPSASKTVGDTISSDKSTEFAGYSKPDEFPSPSYLDQQLKELESLLLATQSGETAKETIKVTPATESKQPPPVTQKHIEDALEGLLEGKVDSLDALLDQIKAMSTAAEKKTASAGEDVTQTSFSFSESETGSSCDKKNPVVITIDDDDEVISKRKDNEQIGEKKTASPENSSKRQPTPSPKEKVASISDEPLPFAPDTSGNKCSRTVVVKNLSSGVTEDSLRDLLSSCGEILMMRFHNRRSPGFASVEFVAVSNAIRAVKRMNGKMHKGSSIKVGFGKSPPSNCILREGVDNSMSTSILKQSFGSFGVISLCCRNKDAQHALIEFESLTSAKSVVEHMASSDMNTRVQIDFASTACQNQFAKSCKEAKEAAKKVQIFVEKSDIRAGESTSSGREKPEKESDKQEWMLRTPDTSNSSLSREENSAPRSNSSWQEPDRPKSPPCKTPSPPINAPQEPTSIVEEGFLSDIFTLLEGLPDATQLRNLDDLLVVLQEGEDLDEDQQKIIKLLQKKVSEKLAAFTETSDEPPVPEKPMSPPVKLVEDDEDPYASEDAYGILSFQETLADKPISDLAIPGLGAGASGAEFSWLASFSASRKQEFSVTPESGNATESTLSKTSSFSFSPTETKSSQEKKKPFQFPTEESSNQAEPVSPNSIGIPAKQQSPVASEKSSKSILPGLDLGSVNLQELQQIIASAEAAKSIALQKEEPPKPNLLPHLVTAQTPAEKDVEKHGRKSWLELPTTDSLLEAERELVRLEALRDKRRRAAQTAPRDASDFVNPFTKLRTPPHPASFQAATKNDGNIDQRQLIREQRLHELEAQLAKEPGNRTIRKKIEELKDKFLTQLEASSSTSKDDTPESEVAVCKESSVPQVPELQKVDASIPGISQVMKMKQIQMALTLNPGNSALKSELEKLTTEFLNSLNVPMTVPLATQPKSQPEPVPAKTKPSPSKEKSSEFSQSQLVEEILAEKSPPRKESAQLIDYADLDPPALERVSTIFRQQLEKAKKEMRQLLQRNRTDQTKQNIEVQRHIIKECESQLFTLRVLKQSKSKEPKKGSSDAKEPAAATGSVAKVTKSPEVDTSGDERVTEKLRDLAQRLTSSTTTLHTLEKECKSDPGNYNKFLQLREHGLQMEVNVEQLAQVMHELQDQLRKLEADTPQNQEMAKQQKERYKEQLSKLGNCELSLKRFREICQRIRGLKFEGFTPPTVVEPASFASGIEVPASQYFAQPVAADHGIYPPEVAPPEFAPEMPSPMEAFPPSYPASSEILPPASNPTYHYSAPPPEASSAYLPWPPAPIHSYPPPDYRGYGGIPVDYREYHAPPPSTPYAMAPPPVTTEQDPAWQVAAMSARQRTLVSIPTAWKR